MIDVVELLQHWHAGRRIGELSSSLGVDPKTIRKYTRPALDAGISPGGPALAPAEWGTLVEGWFPGLVDRSLRQLHHRPLRRGRAPSRGADELARHRGPPRAHQGGGWGR